MPERDRNGYIRNSQADSSNAPRGDSNAPRGGGGGGGRGYSSVRNQNRRPSTGSTSRGYDDYDKDRGRRYNDDDYYGRDDRRSSSDYYSSKGEDNYYGRGSDSKEGDYYGRGGDSKDDNYYGRGGDRDEFGRGNRDEFGRSDDYYMNKDSRRSTDNDRYRGRKRSDSRGGGRGRFDDDDDWKCKECQVWNYPDEVKCSRCGRDKRSARESSSMSSSDDDSRKGKRKKKEPVKREWPPCFDDSGDAFVLDARSGMFYEKESDFFYDPTSKLYYGNKKQSYFSYNAETKTFVPLENIGQEGQPAPPAGSQGAVDHTDQDQLMLVPNGANITNKEPATKTMIAINIKTVSKQEKKRKKRWDSGNGDTLTKKVKQPTAAPAEPANKLQKQHAAFMDKWQERKQEIAAACPRPLVTKHGKPICWVCKRKFTNVEKLRVHEAKSKLHEENLAKQKEKEEAAKAKPVVESGHYVDRAQQRRDMYGPELVLPSVVSTPEAPAPAEGPAPVENPTSNNNIGQQMLEKLGWKAGKALGRGGEHQQEQQAALAQDWDRIESIANQNNNAPRRRQPR